MNRISVAMRQYYAVPWVQFKSQRKGRREWERKKYFEEIMIEIFPTMVTNINWPSQEAK
jgi:hypothetical protein